MKTKEQFYEEVKEDFRQIRNLIYLDTQEARYFLDDFNRKYDEPFSKVLNYAEKITLSHLFRKNSVWKVAMDIHYSVRTVYRILDSAITKISSFFAAHQDDHYPIKFVQTRRCQTDYFPALQR